MRPGRAFIAAFASVAAFSMFVWNASREMGSDAVDGAPQLVAAASAIAAGKQASPVLRDGGAEMRRTVRGMIIR